MGQNGADYSEIWVRQGPPRVQLEWLAAKSASLRTIGDWIVLEYVLGEASLTSLRWGEMVQTTPRYDRQGPRGSTLRALPKERV